MPGNKKTSPSGIYVSRRAKRLFGILLVALGLVAGISLVRNNQNISEDASLYGGSASVFMEPTSGSYKSGDQIKTTIFLSTGAEPVASFGLRLIYKYDGPVSDLAINDIVINPQLTNSGEWTCPGQFFHVEGGDNVVDIACANTTPSGFIGENVFIGDILARVTLSENTGKSLSVFFEPSISIVLNRSDVSDVLAIPASSALYQISTNDKKGNSQADCVISLDPPSFSLPQGQSMNVRAGLRGVKVTSVNFSTNQPELLAISPQTDSKNPYATQVTAQNHYILGHAILRAEAFNGNTSVCRGTSLVSVVDPRR